MSDTALRELAQAAGIAPSWKDVFGVVHEVAAPTLRAVLAALGYDAGTDAAIADSSKRAHSPTAMLPLLVTAEIGKPIRLPCAAASYALSLEDGRVLSGRAQAQAQGCVIPAILEPGYHGLEIGGHRTRIAVAPDKCFSSPDATGKSKCWGLAVQLYALRRLGDAGIGDFSALAEFASRAAESGAQAIGISPVHAQFSADPDRFSPYAPSTRTALNILHAAIDTYAPELEALDLVDWPNATRFRLQRLRELFSIAKNHSEQSAFASFRSSQGYRLSSHATFEALHAHFFTLDSAFWHWRTWPAEFRDPQSSAVQAFAAEHAAEIDFHAWLQFRADSGLAGAQAACRDAGMHIGLISDLAVGTDSGGSQCWSSQQETLLGLTIGAPPDLLQHDGQNWGLTAFSPPGLIQNGFATYRDMLQTALAHAGGIRIDHAMGLNRLWVIPDGATGADGAYLSFPEQDLLRLIKLESHRHRAIVLAEDLGTVPEGFQDRLRESAIDGMRVLWFERGPANAFTPPSRWTPKAAAMTSTHDLPTVAGWWAGRDIDWRERLHDIPDVTKARTERAHDRIGLWQAFRETGSAEGNAPGPDDAAEVVDAACVHVGGSACELVMLPIEDALGLSEQPNLPGTLHEHPNWQRRLPIDVFTEPVTRRLGLLDAARR